MSNSHSDTNSTNDCTMIDKLEVMGLELPLDEVLVREDAYLNSNGTSIMNASTMYYGGAKTGKTRLLTKAFSGSTYIFLDFDRNYKSTADSITDSGALYFNGKAASDILFQIMDANLKDSIVIIDALGSVIKLMCNRYISENIGSDGKKNVNAQLLSDAIRGIGINHADSVIFFNLVIEPMTSNGNSINFIHHTTQNNSGEKMEGNKGAWLSVFDFTYAMDREARIFKLEAGRLPIAIDTIGEDNIYSRINKIIQDNAETVEYQGSQKLLTRYKYISDNKSCRCIVNDMVLTDNVKKIKINRTEYLDANLSISVGGQINPTPVSG